LKMVPDAIAYHCEKSETKNPAKLYWLVISGLIFFKKNATGWKKLRVSFYLTLRKIKNFFDVKFRPSPEAMEVRRAYRNYKKFL